MNTIILKNPFSFPKALNYHITIVDGNDNNKFLVVMELWRIEKPEFISLLVAVYVQGIFVEYHIPNIVLINLPVMGSFKAVAGNISLWPKTLMEVDFFVSKFLNLINFFETIFSIFIVLFWFFLIYSTMFRKNWIKNLSYLI